MAQSEYNRVASVARRFQWLVRFFMALSVTSGILAAWFILNWTFASNVEVRGQTQLLARQQQLLEQIDQNGNQRLILQQRLVTLSEDTNRLMQNQLDNDKIIIATQSLIAKRQQDVAEEHQLMMVALKTAVEAVTKKTETKKAGTGCDCR